MLSQVMAGASLMVLAVAGAASAQTAAPPLAGAATAGPSTSQVAGAPALEPGVQEIVVTATRRSVDLQKVSGTVEALPAATLKALDIVSVQQLPDLTPGLNVVPSGGNNIYLRGIGSASTGYNEAQVAVYIDGLYLPNPATGLYSFNNIEQIEVLKGPQGTLYGRNATAGLISITTRDPDKRPRLDASVSVGNYDTTMENFYGSVPLTDTLAANVAVFHNEQDRGWGVNVFTGHRDDKGNATGVESKLQWTPSSSTKVTASFIFDHSNQDYGFAYEEYPGTLANDGTPYLGHHRASDRIDPRSPFNSYAASLKIQQDIGFANVMSLTGYQTSNERTLFPGPSPDPGSTGPGEGVTIDDFLENNRTWSQEIQITSKPSSSRLDWVGGFFYYHDITEEALTSYPICTGTTAASCSAGLPMTSAGYPTTVSYSGYADATFRLFEATHLTGGLRYTDETKGLTGSVTPLPGRPDSVANLPGSPTAAVEGLGQTVFFPGQAYTILVNGVPTIEPGIPTSEHFTKLTFRGVLAQDFGQNIHSYLSFNRGFKSGAFNANLFSNAPVQPEVLDDYEAGIKTEFFRRRLRFNAAYFYYDYTNVQVRSNAPPAPPGNAFLENVAAEHVKGVDADATLVVTRNLTLDANAEYLDARYDQYPGTTITSPSTKTVNGMLVGVVNSVVGNLAGLPVYNTPPVTISLGATYKIDTRYGAFALTGNEHFNSRYHLAADGSISEGAHNLVDAALIWTAPSKRYDVQFYVRNLLNEYTFANGLVSNSYAVYPGAPRSFGVILGAHF